MIVEITEIITLIACFDYYLFVSSSNLEALSLLRARRFILSSLFSIQLIPPSVSLMVI